MTGPATPPGSLPSDDLDSVTEDAIKTHAPIPPSEWPQDERRAFLGGVYSFRRGSRAPDCPYTDPGCAAAWREGFDRAKRERIKGA